MLDETILDAASGLRGDYEAVDWAATALGPMSSWSPALRSAVDFALNTRFPVTLLWGPEFVMVYNEAYVTLIADKHPDALGARARDVFPEAWETIGPMMQSVLDGEGATWVEDAPVPLERQGFLEECYFTFSYSPVRGEDGSIEGVIDIAAETTRQVIDRRRLELLAQLGGVLTNLTHADEMLARAHPLLAADVADLPKVEIRLDGAPATGEAELRETESGREAWLPIAAPMGGAGDAVLVVELSPYLAHDAEYLDFLRLIARSLGQALDRITVQDAERGLSEALQRSLLTRPPETEHLEIAVRYLPAVEQAQVGGDWYDAFPLSDGSMMLAIGDVAGHDRHAAAEMAQVRNLLRGVAHTLERSPARVLIDLDRTMRGLGVAAFASAVLAQVDEDPGGETGGRTFRWSNAGHPPPVLLSAAGDARLLSTTPEPVLGLIPYRRRGHTAILQPGDAVVFYTDGLVERRGEPLDDSLEQLVASLHGCQALTAEELCDHLTSGLDSRAEDDVALLVVRSC